MRKRVMTDKKTNKKKEDCESCYWNQDEEECPVPSELQGQLSSTGTFYCPFWVLEKTTK